MAARASKNNAAAAAEGEKSAVPASLELEYRLTDSLEPYKRNPRIHSPAQVEQIAASIREFGFNNPILLDSDGTVIAGHGRLEAAKLLGLQEVPCIVLGHLDEAQRRAYLIADNKISLNSVWSEELLRVELMDLKELGADLNVLGFSAMELADITLGKDVEFKEYDESAADDVQLVTCPKCGHSFPK